MLRAHSVTHVFANEVITIMHHAPRSYSDGNDVVPRLNQSVSERVSNVSHYTWKEQSGVSHLNVLILLVHWMLATTIGISRQ